MTLSERERRHQANLARINDVHLVVGRGDRARIDHEGTVFERARLVGKEIAAHRATERGLAALDQLLRMAEDRTAAQSPEVAGFIAAIRDNQPLSPGALRLFGREVGDHVLAVLDAFRYARLSLVEQVEGGPRRVARAIERWQPARA
jgi:hypothetical protein